MNLIGLGLALVLRIFRYIETGESSYYWMEKCRKEFPCLHVYGLLFSRVCYSVLYTRTYSACKRSFCASNLGTSAGRFATGTPAFSNFINFDSAEP
jgi:hypothetical protein